MKDYKTTELATIIGVHPNTVRLYEKLKLIPEAQRQENGYRIFTAFHVEQFRLARLAFQMEVLQNGLRKKIVQMVKAAAMKDFDTALALTKDYLQQITQEQQFAEEAILLVTQILAKDSCKQGLLRKRKEVSTYLAISMDTLRNWEMNGLLDVKRTQNGYRVYDEADIRRLKIIRSLRCANYSLEAILHMLSQLSKDPKTDLKTALDTPQENAEIISVYDQLLTSLLSAKQNAQQIMLMLIQMKKTYS